jgi:hypothetical protein
MMSTTIETIRKQDGIRDSSFFVNCVANGFLPAVETRFRDRMDQYVMTSSPAGYRKVTVWTRRVAHEWEISFPADTLKQ